MVPGVTEAGGAGAQGQSHVHEGVQSDPRRSETVMGEEHVVGRDKDQGFCRGPPNPLDDHELWGQRGGEGRLGTCKCCLIPGQTDGHGLNSSTSPLMKILNLISLASPL